jgi:hypothetical protein
MDIFYIIVLTIAAVLLILILTYVGLTINSVKASAQAFPPTSATCPDYWDVSRTDASLCVIPNVGFKNAGSIYDNTGSLALKPKTTFGYDSRGKTIDFTNAAWDGTGVTTLCAKKQWANNYGIVWDGVSNTNSC